MTVTVHQAREIPNKERGGASSTQVRLLLLPTKKQRHKTKVKVGDDPEYQETFVFKVPPGEKFQNSSVNSFAVCYFYYALALWEIELNRWEVIYFRGFVYLNALAQRSY